MTARRIAPWLLAGVCLAGVALAGVALAGCAVPQQFTTVTVAPWRSAGAPWNSTLWGIATHYKVAGGYQTLAQINSIANPTLIRPGQQIKVPM